jgi:pyridoxamine 5'-phosphate oxidase-like protein
MTDLQPSRVRNLGTSYDLAEMPWSRAYELLSQHMSGPDTPMFLGTVRPDGRPHSAGVGAIWHDDGVYFVSGPGTQKSRNLEANPNCTIRTRLPGLDLVLNGEAERVTDTETLERVAAVYREIGWPAEAAGDAFTAPYSAPSAGPPPWYLYRFTLRDAVALGAAEPHGATHWYFD